MNLCCSNLCCWRGNCILKMRILCSHPCSLRFPCGSAGKESAWNAGDLSLIPGLGRSPGEGKGYPFQYSGLENSFGCIIHGVTKSQTQLRDFEMYSHHFTQGIACGCCLSLCRAWHFCDFMDCRPPGSSVHGISQERILEWVAISFPRGSSSPRDLPDPGIKPHLLYWQADSLPLSPQGRPWHVVVSLKILLLLSCTLIIDQCSSIWCF